jgi:hypothetical protein
MIDGGVYDYMWPLCGVYTAHLAYAPPTQLNILLEYSRLPRSGRRQILEILIDLNQFKNHSHVEYRNLKIFIIAED